MSIRRGFWVLVGWCVLLGCGGDDAPAGAGVGAGGGAGKSSPADAGQANDAGASAGGSGGGSVAGNGGKGGKSSGNAGKATGNAGEPEGQAGTPSGDAGAPGEPSPVARILIAPGGVLLTPDSPDQKLVATVLDADGHEVEAAVEWSSNDEDAVTVDADGTLHARASVGSALVTAKVDGAAATIVALAAEPVAGAVVVSDADITAGPVAVDSLAPFAAGYAYTIDLAVKPPAVGKILLTRGSKPVAGRVSAVDGASVTLEQVPISEIFAAFELKQELRLVDVPDEPLPTATSNFKLGPFECEFDKGVLELEFPKSSRRLLRADTLEYAVDYSIVDGLTLLQVSGNPGATIELEPTLAAAFEGKATCKAVLKEYPIPIPGPAKLFLGASVVVGAGIELGGKIPVTDVGINLKGEVGADFKMGVACPDGACSVMHDITTDASASAAVKAPDIALKFEPEAQAFLYAELEGGAAFTSELRTEAFEARAGFKLAGTFASEETQVEESDYSSKYDLTFEAEVGPGETVDDFFGLLGFALSFLKVEHSEPIASSPTATKFVGSPDAFEAGDDVTFTLKLDPESVTLPLVGYNVEKVRVYRRVVDEASGAISLILANEVTAEEGQTSFDIPWVATVDGTLDGNFFAFITTKLSDLRLEVGTVDGLDTEGILTIGGYTFYLVDAYQTVLPVGDPSNPGDKDLAVARLYYSVAPDMMRVCSDPFLRGDASYISVVVAAETALVPGTYPYADWDGAVPGTASGWIDALSECVDPAGPDNTLCECVSNDQEVFFGGSVTLSEVDGVLVGSVNLTTSLGTTSNTFTTPYCNLTFAEHVALNDETAFECVSPPDPE